MYRPPSIQTLRALEAAARHGSFSRAAEELGITHGAISHRVREIEERLGTRMFDRRGNAMVPTAAARQMLPVVRQALDLIGSLFPPPVADRQLLRIGVLPSFAANWLVQRLDEFHDRHPHIAVSLDARLEVSVIGPGGVDAAIRHGHGDWPGLASDYLLQDWLFPVCSPAYRDRMAIAGIDDFARCRLLRKSWQPWMPWFHAAGLSLAEPHDTAPFDDAGLMLDAAAAGHGIALARAVIARDALAAGQLVRLSPIEIPFDGAYHYAWQASVDGRANNGKSNNGRSSNDRSGAIAAFGHWLKARLQQDFAG